MAGEAIEVTAVLLTDRSRSTPRIERELSYQWIQPLTVKRLSAKSFDGQVTRAISCR